MNRVERVLAVLEEGNGPETKAYIALRTGMSPRAVEDTVQYIRTAALAPIVSDGDGYQLARSADALLADINRGDRRIRTMLQTRSGQRKIFRRMRADEWRAR